MSEADVNAAMYVRFEDSSNIVSAARIAVGGILSSAATAYDLTQLLANRFVVWISLCFLQQQQQDVKVIWQKAPHGGPIPRLGVKSCTIEFLG